MDFLDPNNWHELLRDTHEYRIYLDDTGEVFAVLDRDDYLWAIKWKWCAKRNLNGKVYARRAVSKNSGGYRVSTKTQYLHIEIMKRTGKRRRSAMQVLVDHRNGRSLDCRRINLRWASYQQNNRNVYGYTFKQQSFAL